MRMSSQEAARWKLSEEIRTSLEPCCCQGIANVSRTVSPLLKTITGLQVVMTGSGREVVEVGPRDLEAEVRRIDVVDKKGDETDGRARLQKHDKTKQTKEGKGEHCEEKVYVGSSLEVVAKKKKKENAGYPKKKPFTPNYTSFYFQGI